MDTKWLHKELEQIKLYPRSFIISVLLFTFILGTGIWWFSDILYTREISNLKSDKESLEYRLEVCKEKKIGQPTDKLSSMTNQELKESASVHLQNLKLLYRNYTNVYDTIKTPSGNKGWSRYQKSSEFAQQLWNKTLTTYELDYLAKTILLRDYILKRLPEEYRKKQDTHYYEHPTNPIGYETMLNRFEQLILALPENNFQ